MDGGYGPLSRLLALFDQNSIEDLEEQRSCSEKKMELLLLLLPATSD